MNKGIVMEMSDRHVIVMTPGGGFRKLPKDGRTCEVGEEILFAEPAAARKVPPMAKLSGLVAAVVMCIVVVTAMTNVSGKADVVAYVSMDINPSVEFGIDAAEKVQDLKGLNDDGTKLIEGIDYKGKKLEAVADVVLAKAEELGPLAKGEGDIVIASSMVKPTDKISDSAIAEKLKEQVTKHIETAHPQEATNYDVTAFAAPVEVRAAAVANGLSTGKYAIYLAAKNNGTPLPLDEFKTESIHQLVKDNDGVAAFVNAGQPPAKSVFKELLDEEKSGKLDERAKQLAEQKGKADNDSKKGKNDNKNNNKNDNKNDNKKNSGAKTDEKNNKPGSAKSGANNDNKKDSDTKPTATTPAGDRRSSEQGSSVHNGRTNNQDDDSRNGNKNDYKNDNKNDNKKSDNGKTDDRNKSNQDTSSNSDDNKAGDKPADSGGNGDNNDNHGKNDSTRNDNNKNDNKKNNDIGKQDDKNDKNDKNKIGDNKNDNNNSHNPEAKVNND